MTARTRTLVSLTGGAAMIATLFAALPAHAATTTTGVKPVSFAHARYAAYSSGEMLHLNALAVGGKTVADVEEAFSAGSVSSSGLTKAIVGDRSSGALTVQPAQARGVHAYGTGGGLAVGLASTPAAGDQVQLAGMATATSARNKPVKTIQINTASLGLPAGLVGATATTGSAKTVWSGGSCTLGQPIAYGTGQAAKAQVLSLGALSGASGAASSLNSLLAPVTALLTGGQAAPTATSSGSLVDTGSVAGSRSETYLSAGAGGTFGLTTVEQEDIAPVTINLLGLATITIEVGAPITGLPNGLVPTPIDLAATATGGHRGAKVSLTNDELLEVRVTAGGATSDLVPPTSLAKLLGQGGLKLDLSLGSVLDPYLEKAGIPAVVLDSLGTVLDTSLGSIDLATPVRAINGSDTSLPTPAVLGRASTTEGTHASGAFDLAHVDIAPTMLGTTTTLADFDLGHLEAAASLASPITCGLPVTATSPVRTLKAGRSTTLSIAVPTAADASLVSCSLSGTKVVDTIRGPAFTVTGASPKARIVRHGARDTTVTWYDLSHRYGTRPLALHVEVRTPVTAGRDFTSAVTARTTLRTCSGAPDSTLPPGGSNGHVLTGATVLRGPDVVGGRR